MCVDGWLTGGSGSWVTGRVCIYGSVCVCVCVCDLLRGLATCIIGRDLRCQRRDRHTEIHPIQSPTKVNVSILMFRLLLAVAVPYALPSHRLRRFNQLGFFRISFFLQVVDFIEGIFQD